MDTRSEVLLRKKIESGLGNALEGLVDLLQEIHRGHRELDARAKPEDSIALTVDVFLDKLDLPWGAPKAILRPALVAALNEALRAKI